MDIGTPSLAAIALMDERVDWTMVASISTLLATLVAFFAALLPVWIQRRNARARLKALGRIVVARLQDHIGSLSAAMRIGDATQNADVFNVAVGIALRAKPEQFQELLPHLEGFGAKLAADTAQYIADLEMMRMELIKDNGEVRRAPQDFFSLPDHSPMYKRLLEQCTSVRTSISAFVHGS